MCHGCSTKYGYTDSCSLDLRLKRRKTYKLEFELEGPLFLEGGPTFQPLSEKTSAEVDYSNVDIPYRLTKELLSHFPKAKTKGSLMLDLGCGNMDHKSVSEYAGYEYVGLDYDSPQAPILGDAHSLPFRDNSFEFILSMAVLEHIRFPFVMAKEAYRVLKPHGKFIGTVSFLEPFHSNSFYHHTHLGTLNSLLYGGFQVECVAPQKEWPGLVAQANMGLFPKMPMPLAKAMVLPLQTLHKLWWRVGGLLNPEANEQNRVLSTTGAFTFVAIKRPRQ
jgi:SAM-dependent methyltransferase